MAQADPAAGGCGLPRDRARHARLQPQEVHDGRDGHPGRRADHAQADLGAEDEGARGPGGDPDLRAMQLDPERTYLREAPYGSMDPKERLELLDAEGIDAAILYTTVGLLWEAELDDPELSQAYTRA